MRILRILLKLLIALVVVVATALGLVYWRSSTLLAQHIEVREPALAIPADAEALARGEHIAITRGCTDCHAAAPADAQPCPATCTRAWASNCSSACRAI